ncbi:MAG: histidine phosphotransferase family protein [Pseudomonadota bacterium]
MSAEPMTSQAAPVPSSSAKSAPDAMELAALLTSKVCHDLISPIGAVNNGLEVLADENSADMRDFAMDLIQKSAEQASAKLKFCRMAYGAGSAAGSEINLDDAGSVAEGFFQSDKMTISWNAPNENVAKDSVKLLLNLAVIASSAIPRGGELAIDVQTAPLAFSLRSTGMNARVPVGVVDALAGVVPEEGVDAHSIQNYYTGLVAGRAGMTVDVREDGEAIVVTAR